MRSRTRWSGPLCAVPLPPALPKHFKRNNLGISEEQINKQRTCLLPYIPRPHSVSIFCVYFNLSIYLYIHI